MSQSILFLVIRLGADRYAIEASHVIEVVPLVRLKALHGTPRGVAGAMNYRDAPVPVIDLGLLATGEPTPQMIRTRIVIARYATDDGADGVIGLLVPEATETLRLDPQEFTTPGVANDGAPYLGPVITRDDGVIQRVSIGELLTPSLRDALFPPAVGA